MVPRYRGTRWPIIGNRERPWIEALEAIDSRGETKPLVKLLKSNKSIPKGAKWHIADLLERHQLKRHPGKQATPSYERTLRIAELSWANDYVGELIKKGMRPAAAIEKAARYCKVDEGTLDAFHAGKYNSDRRMKKRRPQDNHRP
jgi:hypothetical protein